MLLIVFLLLVRRKFHNKTDVFIYFDEKVATNVVTAACVYTTKMIYDRLVCSPTHPPGAFFQSREGEVRSRF